MDTDIQTFPPSQNGTDTMVYINVDGKNVPYSNFFPTEKVLGNPELGNKLVVDIQDFNTPEVLNGTDSQNEEVVKVREQVLGSLKTMYKSLSEGNLDKSTYEEVEQYADVIVSQYLDKILLFYDREADPTTISHSINVMALALNMCYKSEGFVKGVSLKEVALGSLLHDIGKTHPKLLDVISKNTQLTSSEYEIVKEHPVRGAVIARNLGITSLNILSVIYCHHQCGYKEPYPSIEEDQPYPRTNLSMLVGLIDSFEAMTSAKRVWREGKKTTVALEELRTLCEQGKYGGDGVSIYNLFVRSLLRKDVNATQ